MSYAVVFSGQGTQHAGMLPWLEATPACGPALRTLTDAIGSDWRVGLANVPQRSRNTFAQPVITGTALAAWDAVAVLLDEAPAAVAGYSVGELAAYACAGVFSTPTAVTLAVQRAALMDAAVDGLDTGLMSVSGRSAAQVLQGQPALECAIQMGADQGIYAGEMSALTAAATALSGQGALCQRLEVRVASHSRWMRRAAAGFAVQLEAVPCARPRCTVVLNASGAGTRDPHALRTALARQIDHTVQWAACLDALAEQGVHCVLEIGAGATLSKMWNQRHPDIPARSLEDFNDAAGAARWLERRSAGS